MEDNTQHQPVEPTTPVPYPYLPSSSPYEHEIGIPPPPPPSPLPQPQQKRRVSPGLLVVCLIIAVLLFLSAGLFYLARTYAVNEAQPTPIIRFIPATPTSVATSVSKPGRTSVVTPEGSPYVADLYSADFNAFYGGFRQAMAAGDFATVGSSADPSYALTCNAANAPSCNYSWHSTYLLLTESHLQFTFTGDTTSYGGLNCNAPGTFHAETLTVVNYSEDGFTSSPIPMTGTAAFGFVDDYIGPGSTRWFWVAAILNSAC